MSILNYFKKVPSEVVETSNAVDLPNSTARERMAVAESHWKSEVRNVESTKFALVKKMIEIGMHAIKFGVSRTVREPSGKFPGLTKLTVNDYKQMMSAEKLDGTETAKNLKVKKGT